MTLGKRKIVSALQKKGFEKDIDGKHIVFVYLTLDGDLSGIRKKMILKTIFTMNPHFKESRLYFYCSASA